MAAQTSNKKRLNRKHLLSFLLAFVIGLSLGTVVLKGSNVIPSLSRDLSNFWQKVTVPKVDYTFRSADKKTGFALLNDNKRVGFKALVGRTDNPKTPQARFEVKDSWIDFSLVEKGNASDFKKEKSGNRDFVIWKGVLPDADFTYQVDPYGLKEQIILNKPTLAQKAVDGHELLTLPFYLTTYNVVPRYNLEGKLVPIFIDSKTGEYRFHIEKPFIVDAKGVRYDALEYELVPLEVALENTQQKTASYKAASGSGSEFPSSRKQAYFFSESLGGASSDPSRGSEISTPASTFGDITSTQDSSATPPYYQSNTMSANLSMGTSFGFSGRSLPDSNDSDASKNSHDKSYRPESGIGEGISGKDIHNLDLLAINQASPQDTAVAAKLDNTTPASFLSTKSAPNKNANDTTPLFTKISENTFNSDLENRSISSLYQRISSLINPAYAAEPDSPKETSPLNPSPSRRGEGEVKGARYLLAQTSPSVSSRAQSRDLSESPTGSRYLLRLLLPREWLADPSRAYPVIIDPTITHNTQTAFATGTLNRVKDEGSADASPSLTSAYHELPADIRTVGLWHMNETSGTSVADSSGNANTGTATGTTVAAGKLGNARSFNGTSDYIGGISLSSFTQFTVEAWIYPTVADTWRGIVGSQSSGTNDFHFQLNPSGGATDNKLQLYVYGPAGQAYSTTSFSGSNLNKWFHVAGVYDGSTIKIYVNGILEGSQSGLSSTVPAGTTVRIGSTHDQTRFFSGLIDEVRISNIARTPEEIKQDAQRFPYSVYTSPVVDLTAATSWTNLTWLAKGVRTGDGETPISQTSLIAQWNFNETSGTTAASGGSCGAACNGTLTNFASTASQDQAAGTGWTSANRRWGAGALMFDGTNDYVTCGTDASLRPANAISVEFWMKPNVTKTDQFPIAYGNTNYKGWLFDYWGNQMTFYARNGSVIGSATATLNPSTGNWYHVVGTYDSPTVKIYINGQLQGTGSVTGPIDYTGLTSCYIGNNETLDTSRYFNGTIDSTRIYSRTLPAAEILANYQAGNIEFQTRTSADNATWEAWKPVTGETQMLSMDSDATNWNPIGTQTNPGSSCSDILKKNRSATNGNYWIQPPGTSTAFQVICDMTNDGGGWTLVLNHPLTTGISATTGWVSGNQVGATADFTNTALKWKLSDSMINSIKSYGFKGTGTFANCIGGACSGSTTFYWKGTCNLNITAAATGACAQTYSDYTFITSLGTTDAGSTHRGLCANVYASSKYGGCVGHEGDYIWTGPFTADSRHAYTGRTGEQSGWQLWVKDQVADRMLTQSNDSTTKAEGTGSMKLQIGAPQVDASTVGLWHMEETSGTINNAFSATGGTITYSGGYTIHTFTSNGTFTPNAPGTVGYLVVAGGGGGSYDGGGGGGGFRTGTDFAVTAQAYPITVGNGGAFATAGYDTATAGGDSVFSSIAATGGGRGGSAFGSYINGGSGGSGGGGAGSFTTSTGGSGTSGQGNNGGNGSINSGGQDGQNGGGGGGASAAGQNAPSYYSAGNGGNGTASSISGASVTYAGGGGGARGGSTPPGGADGTGGTGGGGNGGVATPGTPNTGGGGGGVRTGDGTGGSGIVIIRYPTNAGTPTGTTVVDGFYGKARSFNGTSDYVNLNYNPSFGTGGASIAMWVKTTSTTFADIAFVQDSCGNCNFGLQTVGTTGKVTFVLNHGSGGTTPQSTSVINDGVWHYIVGTRNGTTQSIYVDGVLNNSVTFTNDSANFSYPLILGGNNSAGTIYKEFNGSIDEAVVSNVTRTAEEIAEAYRAGRDHRLSRQLTTTDLSTKTKLPFYVAADRPGTYLEATVGESAFANYEPDANTVGLWHLEEQTGSGAYIKDSSSNGNNGTPTGTTFVQGKLGKARSFNGSSDYIQIPPTSSMNFSNNMTVNVWHKGDTTQTNTCPGLMDADHGCGDYNGWVLQACSTNNKWAFGGGNGSQWSPGATAKTAFNDNQWHMTTGVYDGSYVYLYTDGVLEDKVAWSGGIASSNRRYEIGQTGSRCGGRFYKGLVDEASVSNVARTADEIRQAYEIGKRTHPITIDFVSKPQAAYSSGTTVTVLNPWGSVQLTDTLKVGDTIIFKENVNGTETVSQAVVNTIANTTSTYGTVTLAAAPNFPSGGYTTNATVFKWQREYFDLTGSLGTHRDAITRLTMRVTDGSQGANVWLDDFRSNTNYINDNTPDSFDTATGIGTYTNTSIPSTLNRYFQYRALLSSWDTPVSPQLTSASLNWVSNSAPNAPAISAPTNGATQVALSPVISAAATDADSDYLRYKIQIATDASFSQNLQTFDQSASQTGWSGQNTQTSTAYTSGTTATYTVQTPLTGATTYYVRAYATDPAGSNTWGSASSTVSFTTNTAPSAPTISSPANAATGVSLTPTVQLSTTDAAGDYIRYKLQIATDAAFSVGLQTFDQTASQTGFSGQDSQTATAYTSGGTATYTVQSALLSGKRYFVRAYAIDPGGSVSWSTVSSTSTFLTAGVVAGPCTSQPGGDINISESCSFTGGFEGADGGNLAVKNGATFTINSGQDLVWNPGQSITIETGGTIAINSSATMKESYLYTSSSGSSGYPDPIGFMGAVAVYHMDDALGSNSSSGATVFDSSGSGNNGTAAGTTIVSGKFGNGRSFNGTSDYISAGSLTGGSAIQTVAFWVYPNTTSGELVDLNGTAYISATAGTVSAAGFVSPTIYVNGAVGNTISAGAWQHIAVTTGTGVNASAVVLGKRSTAYFNGTMDEVFFFNRALSAGEVKGFYNPPLSGITFQYQNTNPDATAYRRRKDITSAAAPIGEWKLDEQSGTGAYILNTAP